MKKTYFFLVLILNFFSSISTQATDATYEVPEAELEYLHALHFAMLLDKSSIDIPSAIRTNFYQSLTNHFDKKNLEDALRHLENAKKLGHTGANLILSKYNEDQKISVDPDERLQILHQQADLGSLYSLYNLAHAYEQGLGVDKDLSKALRFYKLSADNGYGLAQYALARKYDKGEGVPIDLDEALRLYKLALEQGILEADEKLDWVLTKIDRSKLVLD
jgi:TPR repeat protein